MSRNFLVLLVGMMCLALVPVASAIGISQTISTPEVTATIQFENGDKEARTFAHTDTPYRVRDMSLHTSLDPDDSRSAFLSFYTSINLDQLAVPQEGSMDVWGGSSDIGFSGHLAYGYWENWWKGDTVTLRDTTWANMSVFPKTPSAVPVRVTSARLDLNHWSTSTGGGGGGDKGFESSDEIIERWLGVNAWWRLTFGSSLAAAEFVGAAVPEPATLIGLGMMSIPVLFRRRR